MQRPQERFIPAGAGNTGRGILLNSQTPVYPRWRGEHANGFMRHCAACGLSPLARGTLTVSRRTGNHRRFIPAGAGNTTFDSMREGFTSVYPRWRGEHNVVLERAPRRNGLSPLARGTRILRGFSNFLSRFIPAGAGNTRRPPSARLSTSVYPRWRGEHSKHNLLLINDFLSQSQSTNFTVSHKQHIHYVKEYFIH